MTTTVELPALDGRSPLGFLAALGLLRVLNTAEVRPLQLSFSRRSAAAILHSPLSSVDEIAERLHSLVSLSPDAAVIGLDPRFPLPASRGGDPMRRPREAFRALVEEICSIDVRAASDPIPRISR